jgi:hypothetical protein
VRRRVDKAQLGVEAAEYGPGAVVARARVENDPCGLDVRCGVARKGVTDVGATDQEEGPVAVADHDRFDQRVGGEQPGEFGQKLQTLGVAAGIGERGGRKQDEAAAHGKVGIDQGLARVAGEILEQGGVCRVKQHAGIAEVVKGDGRADTENQEREKNRDRDMEWQSPRCARHGCIPPQATLSGAKMMRR